MGGGGGGKDGWGEETHYSGFIVCWRDIFLCFFFFMLFLFPVQGYGVDRAGKGGRQK